MTIGKHGLAQRCARLIIREVGGRARCERECSYEIGRLAADVLSLVLRGQGRDDPDARVVVFAVRDGSLNSHRDLHPNG